MWEGHAAAWDGMGVAHREWLAGCRADRSASAMKHEGCALEEQRPPRAGCLAQHWRWQWVP
jgi:hypothetical protein